jgi:hypothetical protein
LWRSEDKPNVRNCTEEKERREAGAGIPEH